MAAAFAKVFLVRKRSGIDKGQLFAMKVLKKVKVIKDSRYTPQPRLILAVTPVP
jgi:hypothetical protein